MEANVADKAKEWAKKLERAKTLDELKGVLGDLMDSKPVQKGVRGNPAYKAMLHQAIDRVCSTPKQQPSKGKKKQRPDPVAKCGNSHCGKYLEVFRHLGATYGFNNFGTRHAPEILRKRAQASKHFVQGENCGQAETCAMLHGKIEDLDKIMADRSYDQHSVAKVKQLVKAVMSSSAVKQASTSEPKPKPKPKEKHKPVPVPKPQPKVKEEKKQAPPAPASPKPEAKVPEPKPAPAPTPQPKVKEKKKQEAPAPAPPKPEAKAPEPKPAPAPTPQPKKACITDLLKAVPAEKRLEWLTKQVEDGTVNADQIRKNRHSWINDDLFPSNTPFNDLMKRARDLKRAQTKPAMSLADLANS